MFGTKPSKEMIQLAEVVSRVLDPILLIPLMLFMAVWRAIYVGERWRFLIILVMIDVVLPAFVLAWFINKGKVLSGWDIKNRQERVPLFLFVMLAHLAGVMGAWFLDKHPLAEYLTSFWILASVMALITLVWKVSVHSSVMSALATFVVLLQGREWVWLFGLVLLVCWARVVGRYHRLSQVLVGAALPMIVMPVSFRVLGIL